MDVKFELGDYKFVRDSEKAAKNFKKHKVKFGDSTFVFLDEYKIDDYHHKDLTDTQWNKINFLFPK